MTETRQSAAGQKAIVVGGGLSGLSAAFRLSEQGWQVKVLEAGNSVGGRAHTDPVAGYLVDTGASVMVTSYKAYFELIDDLGMTDEMVKTNPVIGIPRDGKIHELNLDHLISSGLNFKALSMSAKLRLLRLGWDVLAAKSRGYLDYSDLSKGASLDTESIREYACRTVGREVNDFLCEPLGRIMLICDGDEISKLELLSGVANVMGSEMKTLAGGVNAISHRLAERLEVHSGCRASSVKEFEDSVEVSWIDSNGNSASDTANACVVATQLPDALSICPDYKNILGPLDAQIEYTSAITVAVGTTVRPHTDAFLIPVPPVVSRDLALVFMDHNKCADRSPAGKYLINTHWENRASASNLKTSDEEIAEKTIAELCKFFPEIKSNVDMTHVARWPVALPLTKPGSYSAIAKFNQNLKPQSRLQFAGDYMSAAGQNTAVLYGKKAAENIIASHSAAHAATRAAELHNRTDQ